MCETGAREGAAFMAAEWFVNLAGRQHGPVSTPELKRLADEGRITPDTQIRKGAQGAWFRAVRVPGLFDTGKIAGSQANAAPPPAGRPPPSPLRADPCACVQPELPPRLPASENESSRASTTAERAVEQPPPRATTRPTVSRNRVPSYVWGIVAGVGVAIVGLLCLVLVYWHRPLGNEEIVARAGPSVALINGRFASGTGFVVRPGVVATNKHVLSMELVGDVRVHFPSAPLDKRGPYMADVLYEDPLRDLAFLAVDAPHPALQLAAKHSFQRGQDVIVIGNPGLSGGVVLENAVSKGVMSSEVTLNGNVYYQLGISINAGNSGGPALDSYGRVIGVVTLKANEKEGLAFCVPLTALNDALSTIASMSQRDVLSARSMHRARAVFALIALAGNIYGFGMASYIDAMEAALKERVSVDVGLDVARRQIERRMAAFDEVLVGRLTGEVSKISTDTSLPDSVRQKFVDLWTNYLELKGYVENPRGNLVTYRAKYRELSDKHDRLAESLRLLLGVQAGE